MRRNASRAYAFAALATLLVAVPASAQQHQHGAKPDSAAKAKEMKHNMKGHDMKGHDMKGDGMKGEHDMKGHMMSPWKEMDAFHAVLGGTFHPAADKGDLTPLKSNAQTLADKGKAWAGSTPPAACASDDNKKAVATIAGATADLAEKVKSGAADATLTAAITAIHDTFEKVEHSCVAKGDMKGMKH